MMHTVRRVSQVKAAGCRYRSTSYMEKRRREAKRKEFIPLPDESVWRTYPNERLGNHYNVNWTLAGYGCPPLGDNAFYNLHERHLKMYCDGGVGPNKTISCQREGPQSKHFFVNDGYGDYNFTGLNTIDADEWRRLMIEMTSFVSSSSNLFLTDCIVGARGAEVKVRIISPDPNASLFIKNLYHATSTNREFIQDFKPEVVVYHAPKFTTQKPGVGVGQEPFTVQMLMSGASALDATAEQTLKEIPEGEKEQIANSVAGILLVAGTDSLTELQSSINQITSQFHSKQNLVSLNASVVGSRDGGYVLVSDKDGLLTSKGVPSNLLAQGCLWGEHGVFSTHRGVTHESVENASANGSIAWSVGKKNFVTQAASAFSSSNQPSAFVHFVESGPFVSQGNTKNFVPGLNVAPTGYPFAPEEFNFNNFVNFAQQSTIPVYSINAKNKDITEITKVLQQIAEGTFKLGSQKPQKE
eukprot:TRINITY_DN15916_c0_g1_i1.p1 TRINITY_DN15916_c0_g1~~TRINITY_DN15916_c0_g1_i1.p1  ORF type:complete len:469 (+),score=90.68 TRINITY_DN15916_c0_g1_i1:38-1444(+)